MTTAASLAYGPAMTEHAARALMNGGRAAQSRSPRSTTPTVAPVRPHATTADRRFFAVGQGIIPGVTHERHRGAWPQTVGCVCRCHGNGDFSGRSCDDRDCGEVGERMN